MMAFGKLARDDRIQRWGHEDEASEERKAMYYAAFNSMNDAYEGGSKEDFARFKVIMETLFGEIWAASQ